MKFSPRTLKNLPEPILSASLTTFKGKKKIVQNCQLHSSTLVKLDAFNNPKKYTTLNLKVFKPFIESSEAGELYLFRLGSDEFYVNSEEILDQWTKYLSKKCILDNFEENFIIIKQIGKGATSVVYLAEEIATRHEFAVKCIDKAELIKHRNGVKNVADEIKVNQEIKHANIAELYYVYEDNSFVYMVMEYLPLGDLYKRITIKKALNDDTCAKFMKNLLETIDYLHSNDIVHRDLKLENIIMTGITDYDFKIVDFGLAYSSCATQSIKCGSPGYLAPEILENRRYDNKIDIFSAGVILYILLYGKQPFHAKNIEKVLLKNYECVYKINNSISDGANEVLKMMLQRDPESRPNALQILEHPWLKRNKICSCASIATNSSCKEL